MTDLIVRCRKFLVISFAGLTLLAGTASAVDLDDVDTNTIDGSAVQNGYGIASDYVNWALRNVPWVYNPTNAPPGFTDDEAVRDMIEAAFAEWEGACGITFSRATATGIDATAVDSSSDALVTIVWDAAINPAAGRAGPRWTTDPTFLTLLGYRWALDGSFELEPSAFDDTGLNPAQAASNLVQFHGTLVHETGHLIGLGHSDNPDSIMFSNPYNSIPHITGDDIDSCRSMYGYSNIFSPVPAYEPPPLQPNNLELFYLARFTDINTPNSTIDATDDDLTMVWGEATAGPDITMTAIAVDPDGNEAWRVEHTAASGGGWGFTIGGFGRYRENPGVWTIYVLQDGAYVGSLTATVTTGWPAFDTPPVATLTFTEDPATREIEATVDVTSADPGATEVQVTWHIAGTGLIQPPAQAVGTLPYSNTQNIDYNDAGFYEISVEVTDDVTRYDGVAPGTGPAGGGFQTLLPYFSFVPNLGPDFDGDNASDILWYHTTNGGVFFWGMHGNLIDPRGAVAQLTDLSWSIVGQGDYNGDGKSDLMWMHSGTGQVYFWSMDGSSITGGGQVAVIGDPVNWSIVGNGDYDGDGKADLMWRNGLTGQIYFWKMNGSTISSSGQVAINNDANWTIISNKDGDGDGRSDLIWLNTATGQVYFWQMNGSTITGGGQIAIIADPQWRNLVASGDLNGDGRHDLVWRHGVSGKVYYWEMEGTTILLSSRISIVGDLQWRVIGDGDYNGDGWSDLLWYHDGTGEIYHWQQSQWTTLRSGQVGFNTDMDWEAVNLD